MSDRHHEEKSRSISKRIVRFFQRYRIVLLVLAAGAVLFPIVYYVVSSINQRMVNDGAAAMYELDKQRDDYNAEQDADKKADAKRELFQLIGTNADRFQGWYAGAYALLMRADINYQDVTAPNAADTKEPTVSILRDLSRVVDTAGDNVLVPLALTKLGTIVQNLDNLAPAASGEGSAVGLDELMKIVPRKALGTAKPEKIDEVAFAVFQNLVDRFPKSLYTPQALVNMGFLLEAKGDAQGAYDLYGRLESDYGTSLWTKIAVNRKIAMEAEGLVKN
ncbi:MAG: hypothetical protein JXD23_11570 [Spirochaetales bacterium]|nr:hypothetical protein [Spirochaetales bacterium]